MARFRGTIQGNRGQASRLGSANSGLIVEANGWDFGIRVTVHTDAEDHEIFEVYKTGGSHGQVDRRIARYQTRGGSYIEEELNA